MRNVMVGLMAALAMVALLGGCSNKVEETVVEVPPQDVDTLPMFPEEQVPDPEPQPGEEWVAGASAPPVDTAVEKTPAPEPEPEESYAPPEPEPERFYVVKKGDTLQKISMKYYNTTKKWRRIYEANREVLKKGPNAVQIGMKLRIP